MAIQNANGARSVQMASKAPISNGKKMLAKSQPISGKLGADMSAQPGSKGKGQAIATVPSNPVSGKTKSSGTAMGSGAVINGMV